MIRTDFSRYEFPELIDQRGYKYAVEVGVNLGQYSYYLLKHSKLNFLWSIDAYRGRYKTAKAGAETLLEPFTKTRRCDLWQRDSVSAAKVMTQIAAKLLTQVDFVYIDAAHDKLSVAADLEAWYPLVRSGGLLAGHDYCKQHPGVIEAVNEFAERRGLELKLTREEWASWMFEVA